MLIAASLLIDAGATLSWRCRGAAAGSAVIYTVLERERRMRRARYGDEEDIANGDHRDGVPPAAARSLSGRWLRCSTTDARAQ
jgi:hypothetical protein